MATILILLGASAGVIGDASSPLHGCADPAAGYVVTGYSFGGYTAYATAGALVNDGIVPTLSQFYGRVIDVVVAAHRARPDHLGKYSVPKSGPF